MAEAQICELDDSPFSSAVYTNYIPSAEEIRELKALLFQPEHELSRVELEVAHLEAALDKLQCKRGKLKEYIAAHRALMSPVRRLPPETIAEIFMWCLPSEGHPTRSMEQAPLMLTMICRGWRELALRTPALWTSLHLSLPPAPTPELFLRRFTGARIWLDRSGSLPLSLSLHIGRPHEHPDLEEQARTDRSLFEWLMRWSSRLAELMLHLDPRDLSSMIELSPKTFPALNSFHLRILTNYWPPNAKISLPSLLNRMSGLRKLTVDGLENPGAQYVPLSCDWGKLVALTLRPDLRHVDGGWLNPVQVLAILAHTPVLSSLDVEIANPNADASATFPDRVTRLDHLNEMRLSVTYDHDPVLNAAGPMTAFFERIVCPSLKLLSVLWGGPTLAICPFPTSILSTVESLRLWMSLTPEAFTQCLHCAPNLVSLRLVDQGSSLDQGEVEHDGLLTTLQDYHLQSLSPSETNPLPLCPKLRHVFLSQQFRYQDAPQGHVSSDSLVGFIEARAKAHMLSSCVVHLSQELVLSETDLRKLRTLQSDGLELSIRFSRSRSTASNDPPDAGIWSPSYDHGAEDIMPLGSRWGMGTTI